MAIAVNGGHVARALDFYEKSNKYIIIGGSTPWTHDPEPDLPSIEDYKLVDVIGLKRIDNTFLVVPDSENGTIVYRSQKWKIITKELKTTIGVEGVTRGSNVITVTTVAGITVGNKLRIDNEYEGRVVSISGNSLTLDTNAPVDIRAGRTVEGGAFVEGAKYVYIEGYLEYDRFPLETYRQVGLCTGVVPKEGVDPDILLASAFNAPGKGNDYESLGLLEVLNNRAPIPRDANMRELVSMVIEF